MLEAYKKYYPMLFTNKAAAITGDFEKEALTDKGK